jgi:glycosyltransferase involved in cell wall biosynthesis
LSQTLREIEIIAVDAGSTDGTLELLREYSARDSRIRLLLSDRKSYGYQVNMGIDEANGEYIAVVETDDYIDSDMYSVLYTAARSSRAEVVKGDYDMFITKKDGSTLFVTNKMFSGDNKKLYGRVICPLDYPFVHTDDISIWKGIYDRGFILDNNIRCNETSGAAYQDRAFTISSCAARSACCIWTVPSTVTAVITKPLPQTRLRVYVF